MGSVAFHPASRKSGTAQRTTELSGHHPFPAPNRSPWAAAIHARRLLPRTGDIETVQTEVVGTLHNEPEIRDGSIGNIANANRNADLNPPVCLVSHGTTGQFAVFGQSFMWNWFLSTAGTRMVRQTGFVREATAWRSIDLGTQQLIFPRGLGAAIEERSKTRCSNPVCDRVGNASVYRRDGLCRGQSALRIRRAGWAKRPPRSTWQPVWPGLASRRCWWIWTRNATPRLVWDIGPRATTPWLGTWPCVTAW